MPADKTRGNRYQPRVSGQLPDLGHPQNVTSASFGARDCRLFERLSRRPHLRPFEDRLENRIPVVCVGHRPCMSLLTHVPLGGCSGLLLALEGHEVDPLPHIVHVVADVEPFDLLESVRPRNGCVLPATRGP